MADRSIPSLVRHAAPARSTIPGRAAPVAQHHLLLGLQGAAGNRAVQRLVAQNRKETGPLLWPTSSKIQVQACRGEVHRGCDCAAGTSLEADGQHDGDQFTADDVTTQRAPADAAGQGRPPLTSPRFAGDVVLEACHQDKARLAQGAKSDSVRKIQQALVDLDFDLGPSGVDADYGPRTAAAVRAFKAREALGSEQFGDVGPGTMSRLDELLPGEAPPPVPPPVPAPDVVDEAVEEDGTLSCPVDKDVVTAVESEAELAAPLERNALQAGSPKENLTTSPTPPSILTAVAKFKNLVNEKDAAGNQVAGANISNKGQFYVIGKLREVIGAEITRIANSGDVDSVVFATKARAAMADLKEPKISDPLIAECDRIAKATQSPEKSAMKALLRSAGSGGTIDAALFAALDLSPNDAMPQTVLVQFRSIRAARAVFNFDLTACGGAALRIARRVQRRGGVVPRKAKGADVSARLAAGTGFEDLRPMGSPSSAREPAATAAVTPTASNNSKMFGDVLDQVGVAGVVAQIRSALADGKTVHCRVLSGLGYGVGTTATGSTTPSAKAKRAKIGAPPEEHSLLLIGSDGANIFVFHDPDAGVSHSPEPGFGLLTFDAAEGRFSTAENAGDLVVAQDGKHARGDKRYQVISAVSV